MALSMYSDSATISGSMQGREALGLERGGSGLSSLSPPLPTTGMPLHPLLAAHSSFISLHATLASQHGGQGMFPGMPGSLFGWPGPRSPQSPPLTNNNNNNIKPTSRKRPINNNNNEVVSSTSSLKRSSAPRKRQAKRTADTLETVTIPPPPPLSPPTSGSSPQSNGSSTSDVKPAESGRDKVFTCLVCNRSFGYKHVLQNHERTHTGEKPFECAQCHKRFTRDHHLKTHMRLHTGEKPYHCSHCDRQFVQVANLRRHLRVHTGEKPYACEMCSSRFSDSNQLKAHILIHRGEKPFSCQHCQGRFRRRHHLEHHKCPGWMPVGDDDATRTPTAPTDAQGRHFLDMEDEEEERLGELGMTPPSSARKERDWGVLRVPALLLPEQTEPEDLSVRRPQPPPARSPHSGTDSPMRSPWSEDLNDDDHDLVDASTTYLQHRARGSS